MKQRLFFLFALALVILVLIALNAATFVQKRKLPDREDTPDRSTFNSGATGTRAFYDLLAETGTTVERWREPLTMSFRNFDSRRFSTFIVIGRTLREFDEEEVGHLLNWISAGGQLVLIDREPNEGLLVTSATWQVGVEDGPDSLSASEKGYLLFSVDPSDRAQMTSGTEAAKPVQPSVFNWQVNAVQPSKFARSVVISKVRVPEELEAAPDTKPGTGGLMRSPHRVDEKAPAPSQGGGPGISNGEPGQEDDIKGSEVTGADEGSNADRSEFENPKTAPVIHLSNNTDDLLADFPFGAGRIVVLADPYIVSNAGIDLVDNSQLAVNIVTSRGGKIVFDEYHQGRGNDENRLLAYFTGTPVVAMFLQLAALAGLIIYSKGRRFGRPLPAARSDRLSKLEYVAAMAQLQERTKAFDLAVENIYADFRRRVSRFFSVDNYTVSRERLAAMIAERISRDETALFDLMGKCEDIMHGEPTRKKEVLRIVRTLREIEEELGLERGRHG